jgi:hypothetical protein
VDPVPDPLLSENLVVPLIESGTSGSVARNSDHQTTEAIDGTYLQTEMFYILTRMHPAKKGQAVKFLTFI